MLTPAQSQTQTDLTQFDDFHVGRDNVVIAQGLAVSLA
uniref:Uncharacterized protein n=1 Tax=Peronospora matthiolae TaxID=2874970 RepID=A0AAV1SY84_9STRA